MARRWYKTTAVLFSSHYAKLVLSLSKPTRIESESSPKCGLYMAPSSTSPHILGLYTAKDLPFNNSKASNVKSNILSGVSTSIGPPGLSIQFIDSNLAHDNTSILQDSYLEELIWTPSFTGGSFEVPRTESQMTSTDVVTLVPGLGMIGAFNPKLTNAAWDKNSTLRRKSDHKGRVSGPGAGAYSYYHNVTSRVVRDVWAGEEIFIDFGSEWEESGNSTSEDKNDGEREATLKEYHLADEKIKAIKLYFDKFKHEMDEETQQSIWNYLLSIIMDRNIRKLIPLKVTELDSVHKYGSLLHANKKSIKSIKWLKKNGRCADSLKSDISTLPNAGRGAFVTRPTQEGDIITTTPLAPILDKSILDASHTENTSQKKQILLNYCFGHPKSSLLLFPYGDIVNFINHKSAKNTNVDERPNAKLRWADSFSLFQSHYLDKPIDELTDLKNPALFFDVIATRDIAEGEEVFIDYGENWEMSWRRHASEWNYTENNENDYMSHLYLNEQMQNDPSLFFRTNEEQIHDPYPKNVMLICFVYEGLLLFEGDEMLNLTWSIKDNDYDGDTLHPCDIIDRKIVNEVSNSSNILENMPNESEASAQINHQYKVKIKNLQDKLMLIEKVPHSAIMFMEKPGFGDVFLPSAFRHEIELNDDIFPESWKNLKA